MITILKVPIYLSVETDNIDRFKVTSSMQKIIIPQLVRILASYGNKLTFNAEEKAILQKEIGSFHCKMLTDVEAMTKRDDS